MYSNPKTNKFIVKMNNIDFSSFPTRKMADEYCKMQREKMRAGGTLPSNAQDDKKAFAARQNWSVVEK